MKTSLMTGWMRLSAVAMLGAFLAIGCGGSTDTNNNNDNHNHNHSHNQNSNDNHSHGDKGDFKITATLEGGEAKTGQNVLMIEVMDKDGKAVEGATVTVDPQMPSMGHGSSEKAKVEEVGGGKYKATPVTFTMAGPWTVTINVEANGDTGSKTFDFNVK